MITAEDAKLVEALKRWKMFPEGETAPAGSDVAVIRRGLPEGTGDVAWMPDANTYCLVSIRERGADRKCIGLPAQRKPRGYVNVGRAAPHGLSVQGGPTQMWLTVSVVENTDGPFTYSAGTPQHATPLQEGTVRFPSGRTMTFLTYEFPEATSIPHDAEICSPDRTVCFQAFEATARGE
ncbi:hypothetical protein [Streptomyces sp. NPDC091371]|uniref:hypothetical protein n=1 Tax=Streptomyces sp. NPDC091371 TaxID=3155303 RepID=UPI0034239759